MKTRRTKKSTPSMRELLGRKLIYADVTLKSRSGRSIHEKGIRIDTKTVAEFLPSEDSADIAEKILRELGLEIIARGPITISVAAPMDQFQKIFAVKLTHKRIFPYAVPRKQRIPNEKGCGVQFLYKGKKRLPIPESLRDRVDAIHLGTPIILCTDADPPTPAYFHLKVPDDVARLVDATTCHKRGITGSGIRLVMPDQGIFSHPYYTARGYDISVDEGAYDGSAENKSHGTAIAANALAVAPGVEFIGVRNGSFITSATAAFQRAVALSPDVISISWGTESDVPDLRAAVALAINAGIVICCACGNGGTLVFPSSIAELISVGGTYANEHDQLTASTYASSGILAGVDPGRKMPDLTGYVGNSPAGVYITLPAEADSKEDNEFAGPSFPDNDETAEDDGWIVASGTSSATPQVAGVACLLMHKYPSLRGNPAAVKQILMDTATDVTAGSSANGQAAAAGLDDATGHGVVDAYIAINQVDIWVQDHDLDTGLVPARGAFWICPDIKVLSAPLANPNAGFNGAVHIDRPVFGETYYVYIRARNRGISSAQNVTVGLYFADPSLMNSFPADWNSGSSDDPAHGQIMVDGIQTNIFFLDLIPAHGSAVAGPYVWTPPAPTSATQVDELPSGQHRGHFCLLARLECPADPVAWPGGDMSTIWQDNNLGLKNLWVVEPEMTFPLMVGGDKRGMLMRIRVDLSALPKGSKAVVQLPKRILDKETLAGLKTEPAAAQKSLRRIHLPAGKPFDIGIKLESKVPIRMWFECPNQPGGKHAPRKSAPVDITQWIGKKCVGGARFMVKMK